MAISSRPQGLRPFVREYDCHTDASMVQNPGKVPSSARILRKSRIIAISLPYVNLRSELLLEKSRENGIPCNAFVLYAVQTPSKLLPKYFLTVKYGHTVFSLDFIIQIKSRESDVCP